MDKLLKTSRIETSHIRKCPEWLGGLLSMSPKSRRRNSDDAGPFTRVVADALTIKVREGSRVANTMVMTVTRLVDHSRELPNTGGVQAGTSETATVWDRFFAFKVLSQHCRQTFDRG